MAKTNTRIRGISGGGGNETTTFTDRVIESHIQGYSQKPNEQNGISHKKRTFATRKAGVDSHLLVRKLAKHDVRKKFLLATLRNS